MADNTEKKVLISVEVLDNFVAAKKNLDEWKGKMKEAQASSKTTAEEQRKITTELAKATVQYKEANKALLSASKTQDILSEATDRTNLTLGQMKAQLTALRNTPFDGLTSEQIQQIEQSMADLKAEIDDYNVKIKGLDTGEWASNAAKGVEFVAASFSALGNTLNILGVDSEILGEIEKKTTELIAVVQAMGVVTEFLDQKRWALIKANAVAIYSENNLRIAKLFGINVTAAQAAGEEAMIIIKGKSSIASKAAAVAQWIWNSAILANPIMWIVAGVGLLVAGIVLLTNALDTSAAAQKKAEAAQKAYAQQSQVTTDRIKANSQALENEAKKIEIANNAEMRSLKEKHASSVEISKAQLKNERELAELRILNSKRNISDYSNQLNSLRTNISAQTDLVSKLSKHKNDKYYEELHNLNELKRKRNELVASINSEYNSQLESNDKILQAKSDLVKEEEDLAKKRKYSLLDYQQKFNEQQLSLLKESGNQNFDYQQKFNESVFEASQTAQKKKLDAQLKYHDIEKTEYNQQYSLLKQASQLFYKQQADDAQKYYQDKQKELLGMVKNNVDYEISEINSKYNKAIKDLNETSKNLKAPARQSGQTDEEYDAEMNKYKTFILNKALYETQLNEQKEQDIKDANQKYILAKAALSSDKIDEQHANELLKYHDNERKKLDISLKAEQDKLDALKKLEVPKNADGTVNEDAQREKERLILESENRIAGTKLSLDTLTNNTALLNARKNADETYRIKKEALDKELAAAKDNADKQAEIKTQLEDLDKEYFLTKTQQAEMWASKATELMSAYNDYMKAQGDAELQKYEEQNTAKKESLDKQLKSGAITKAKYDREIKKSDDELAANKKRIAIEQAQRERLVASFTAAVNTAAAIIKFLADPGGYPGIALSVIAGITGAAQIAAINSAPMPKAEKGMFITRAYRKIRDKQLASRGTLLFGPSHANGGIPIEAEGGEAIINKRSTSMFKPLLSAINEAGGGVKFADGGIAGMYATTSSNLAFSTDGGYSARSQERSLSYDDIERAMSKAVSGIKIYSTVEDYRRADKNYTNMESAGNV